MIIIFWNIENDVKIEAERVLFIRLNQEKLRSEEYVFLKDSLTLDSIDNVGQIVVLPSTFVGSPRYMHEKMQDDMCYILKFGTAAC